MNGLEGKHGTKTNLEQNFTSNSGKRRRWLTRLIAVELGPGFVWKTEKWGRVSFEVMIKISVFGHVMFEMPISNPRRHIFKVETSM